VVSIVGKNLQRYYVTDDTTLARRRDTGPRERLVSAWASDDRH